VQVEVENISWKVKEMRKSLNRVKKKTGKRPAITGWCGVYPACVCVLSEYGGVGKRDPAISQIGDYLQEKAAVRCMEELYAFHVRADRNRGRGKECR